MCVHTLAYILVTVPTVLWILIYFNTSYYNPATKQIRVFETIAQT